MRILVVNVNTTASMTEAIAASARAVAGPSTEIVPLTPAIGADPWTYSGLPWTTRVMPTPRAELM